MTGRGKGGKGLGKVSIGLTSTRLSIWGDVVDTSTQIMHTNCNIREEPSVTARFFVTTSRVLPSQLSVVSHVVVVSSVFLPVSASFNHLPLGLI